MTEEQRSECQPARDDPWHDRQARSGERDTPLEGHQPFTGDDEPCGGDGSDQPTSAAEPY